MSRSIYKTQLGDDWGPKKKTACNASSALKRAKETERVAARNFFEVLNFATPNSHILSRAKTDYQAAIRHTDFLHEKEFGGSK